METFCPARNLVENPGFDRKKDGALKDLDPRALDPEMRDLVAGFNRLAHCYTLQCCHGHIILPGDGPPEKRPRLPVENPPEKALYQLAYLALVVRNNGAGRRLADELALVADRNPAFIQLGSPAWFWQDCGQKNSFALQVSPEASKHLDRFEMTRSQALEWIKARTDFMAALERILDKELSRQKG